jgi:trehalose utilization protein
MIRVTIWYEYTQEKAEFERLKADPGSEKHIFAVYPDGVMQTLADALRKNPDMDVRLVNMYMPECGLTDEVIDSTDVLIWWAHHSHDDVPDRLVSKVVERVNMGMGFIALHSAHKSKPFMALMGTSGCLKWRDGDFERVWTVDPSHPIAAGIPEYFELPREEMYGEPFDIARPDDVVFMGWFRGGEVFRCGCTWQRGYGKVFYFQPGHESNPSFNNPYVIRIITNAVRWAAPAVWREKLDCPNPAAPEASDRS